MLNELSKKFDKDNIGLYRDDGLSVFKNNNGHQNDKVRKEMTDLFRQNHPNLEIKCNLKIVDYLNITFDLTTVLFKSYNKTNNCLNHTIRPTIFHNMLMQNQITRHTERNTEIFFKTYFARFL